DQLLIAEVEAAVGDDGVGPDLAGLAVEAAFARDLEAAGFVPAGGAGVDQDAGAGVLAVEIEPAVGAGQGALAQLAAAVPDGMAGLEVLANPAAAVGEAVDVLADAEHAAVMIDQHAVGPDFDGLRFLLGLVAGQPQHAAARGVAGADVDLVVVKDRCR